MTRLITIDADHPSIDQFVKDWTPIATHGAERTTASAARYIHGQIKAQSRIDEPGLYGVVYAGLDLDSPFRTAWVHYTSGWYRAADDNARGWDDLIDPILIREGTSR